jgi:hypothetical protein
MADIVIYAVIVLVILFAYCLGRLTAPGRAEIRRLEQELSWTQAFLTDTTIENRDLRSLLGNTWGGCDHVDR